MIHPIVNIIIPINLRSIEKKNRDKLYVREHIDSNGVCHVKIASTSFPLLKAIAHFIVEIFTKYHYTHGDNALKKIHTKNWRLNTALLEIPKKTSALFTSSVRISAKRETPDGAAGDEGIASAIAKETDAPDGRFYAGRKLTEEVNTAKTSAISTLYLKTNQETLVKTPKRVATPFISNDEVQPKKRDAAQAPKTMDAPNPIAKDSLFNKSSFVPPFIISDARLWRDALSRLQNAVKKYNQHSKTKINLKKDADSTLLLCHTRFEINSLVRDCPELRPFFTNKFGKSCFGSKFAAYISSEGLSFYVNTSDQELYSQLKSQYANTSIQKQPKIDLPKFDSFSGSEQEISQVFKSMLSNSQGIIIGEIHTHKSPKKVLKEQVENLHREGVRTLFLEHCCYDTLQPELEEFYSTGKASPFLKNFLSNGCGGAVGGVNYYEMVKAAVKAGIRPVGLELSSTQLIGFQNSGGSHGEKRYIGMNIPAKEIIEREAGEGKYIALVGSAHVSYCEDVAGLSELCGASSMVISNKKKGSNKPPYQTNQEFLGYNMSKTHNVHLFNNSTKVYFTQVHMYL